MYGVICDSMVLCVMWGWVVWCMVCDGVVWCISRVEMKSSKEKRSIVSVCREQ